MKFKKIIAVAIAAVMTAAALALPASAESIADTAVSKKSGESISIKLNNTDNHDYKVKLTKGGDLKINLTSAAEGTLVFVYDSDGSRMNYSKSESKVTSGKIDYALGEGENFCHWNSTMEKFKGTLVYKDLDKGTYYIRIRKVKSYYTSYSGQGKATIKFTFPGESADSDDSGSASGDEITMLQFTLEEDDDITLSAVKKGSGTVTWSSSDESVATVSSKGKVRARNVGTAIITAKCGSSTQKIQIKVVYDD